MPPRPILKGLPSSNPSFVSSEATSNPLPFSSCSTVLDTPHVHFPPTPTLTSTEVTHSSFIYDRAPIVVAPNTCALPERGGRKLTGTNSNKGGPGYFHPHAMLQVDAVRTVERDSSETVSPTIFSATCVTVTNVNDRGSVGLFMQKRSGSLHEYDQPPNHDQHTQHPSSNSSDLGVFCSPPPPPPYVPTSPLSSTFSPSSSIPHSSVNLSTWNVYNIPTAPPTPGSTTNYKMDPNCNDNDSYPNQIISHTHIGVYDSYGYPSTSKLIPPCVPPSSSNGSPVKPHDRHQDNKKDLVDADGKKRRKSKGYTHNRVEGDRTTRTLGTQYNNTSRREFELQGCLGGF